MSSDRPGVNDKHDTVSGTELKEALENNGLENGRPDVDRVQDDEGQPSPRPQPDDAQRVPDQDVATAQSGEVVEPPD